MIINTMFGSCNLEDIKNQELNFELFAIQIKKMLRYC